MHCITNAMGLSEGVSVIAMSGVSFWSLTNSKQKIERMYRTSYIGHRRKLVCQTSGGMFVCDVVK
jgi:hypothetical protein